MIPILYDQYETLFTSNGYGRLNDCISCTVTEERNGVYECEFTYPITGKHYDQLTNGATIGVIHDDNKDVQPFDVYSYTAPIDGVVTFYAHHISYRLNNIIVKPFEASSVAQAMALIVPNSVNPNPFTFWTDKSVSTNFGLAHPNSVRALLGGHEGSILDVYGKGDYKYDKFEVRLYVDRGSDTGVTIRYGKNLVDVQKNIDKSGSYSAIAPYWTSPDNEVVYLPEIYVVSPTVPAALIPWTSANNEMTDGNGEVIYFNAAQIVPMPVDFTGEFMQEPTEAQLRQAAIDYLDTHNTWLPNENITIDFTQLWQTPEYENVAVLQRVGLCDTVSVYYPELGLVATDQKVIKVVYNVLNECFDSMELGQLKITLARTLQDGIGEQVVEEVTKQLTAFDAVMQAAIDYATKQITGGTGGYVVMTMNADNQPQELLIMDTPSTQTAVNVWRWNSGGLGHSHSGYNGPYNDVALTQDGKINAAMITTGIMTATLIRAGVLQDLQGYNYWNLETGEFRLAATTAVGNSTIATQANITTLQNNITSLDSSLNQQEIFNRLTNNGQTQGIYLNNGLLYINASYIQSGTLSANRIKGGTLEVGGLNDENGKISILDSGGVERGTVTAEGFETSILADPFPGGEQWTYRTLFGASSTKLYQDDDLLYNLYPLQVKSSNVNPVFRYSSLRQDVTAPYYRIYFNMSMPVLDGALDRYVVHTGAGNITFAPSTTDDGRIHVFLSYCDVEISNSSGQVKCYPDMRVYGNFQVSGTKSRTVQIKEYSGRSLYCYETPSPMFGDVGEGVIDETGLCYVFLDPVFAETITTSQYQVFLQRYGEGDCYVSERHPDYFVVKGEPGLAFGWELKAKQKDFDQMRLERKQEEVEKGIDYGAEGQSFYINLEEGRIA